MKPTAYRRNARSLRDRQAFEHISMQAVALFAAGHSQAEVARELGSGPTKHQPLARQLAARWAGSAVQRRPHRARPRLSDAQLAAVDQALREGARVHGFDTTTGAWLRRQRHRLVGTAARLRS